MKTISKKLLEMGCKSTNVKTMLKKLPAIERKKWEGKEGLIQKDLEAYERKKAIEARKAEIAKAAKEHGLSVKEYQVLHEKAKTILSDFHTGHSMGCYRTMKLEGKLFATDHILQDYAKSCKYKPAYGGFVIDLTKKELREINEIGLVWTVKGKEVAPKVFEEKHLKPIGSKHNYSINWESGFLTSNFHAKTIEGAMAWRNIRAIQLLKSRNEKLNKEKLKTRFVGFEHSLKAGNCEPGTLAFCQKYNLDPKMGYRLDYILSLEESTFTEKLFSVL
jgi:hypothetical protein